jgi:hypothetical protein
VTDQEGLDIRWAKTPRVCQKTPSSFAHIESAANDSGHW